jgi:hypothetical protein
MKMKTQIIHQYKLPLNIINILALSCNKSIGFGVNNNLENKFVILESGEYQILDYDFPKDKHSNKGALFKTKAGFGCVFDKKVVKYSFSEQRFESYLIDKTPPTDKNNRKMGPLKASVINDDNDLLVLHDDYFYEGTGRFISRLRISPILAKYDPFFFSIPVEGHINIPECCDIEYENKIIFHKNSSRKIRTTDPDETSQLCELKNGNVVTISETSKGFASFSSDKKHLMIKTYQKPYRIEFYFLSGDKDFEIKLTPKKALGDVDKVYLSNFDKYENRLWLCSNADVTETEIIIE